MWKRILEPLRKKLKGENGVRLVMLLGATMNSGARSMRMIVLMISL